MHYRGMAVVDLHGEGALTGLVIGGHSGHLASIGVNAKPDGLVCQRIGGPEIMPVRVNILCVGVNVECLQALVSHKGRHVGTRDRQVVNCEVEGLNVSLRLAARTIVSGGHHEIERAEYRAESGLGELPGI